MQTNKTNVNNEYKSTFENRAQLNLNIQPNIKPLLNHVE